MPLLKRMEQAVQRHGLFLPGSHVVVAVSGGPDSTALLDLLHRLSGRWRLRLTVAHVNYRLRGQESDADADFVRELARRYGCPLALKVLASGEMPETAVQERARQIRYEFLAAVAAQVQPAVVAVGHHLDDQAETVLLRLLRGTGAGGLAGMRPKRPLDPVEAGTRHLVWLVRPLLDITRAEIEEYCAARGLSYRQDRSNFTECYERNRIRLEILPQLRRHNPRLPWRLAELAASLQGDVAFLEEETSRAAALVVRELPPARDGTGWRLMLRLDRLLALPLAVQRRLIRLAYRRVLQDAAAMLDLSQTEQVLQLISGAAGAGRALLPRHIQARREYGWLWLEPVPPRRRSPRLDYPLRVPGETAVPGLGGSFVCSWRRPLAAGQGLASPAGVLSVWVDPAEYGGREALAAGLHARNRSPGDRLRPHGAGGSKKLQDLFTQRRLRPERRDEIPLLAWRDQILWVVGLAHGPGVFLPHELGSRSDTHQGQWLHIEYRPEQKNLD